MKITHFSQTRWNTRDRATFHGRKVIGSLVGEGGGLAEQVGVAVADGVEVFGEELIDLLGGAAGGAVG